MEWLSEDLTGKLVLATVALVAVCICLALMSLLAKSIPRFDPFGDKCAACGKCALAEHRLHTTPPVPWSLWYCLKCGSEFVKEGGRTIPRKEYTGDLLVEFFFLVHENPETDSTKLWNKLISDRHQFEDGDGI